MNPEQALSHLRDVHQPLAISWWPLAPGWWILIALGLLVLLLALTLIFRRFRKTAFRRVALRHLEQIAKHSQPQCTLRDVSQLLRRVCLTKLPRVEAASLTGDAWLSKLETMSTAKLSEEFKTTLQRGLYDQHFHVDNTMVLSQAKEWIRRVQC